MISVIFLQYYSFLQRPLEARAVKDPLMRRAASANIFSCCSHPALRKYLPGMNTISIPEGNQPLRVRYSSRSILLARFRLTALPNRLPTLVPTLLHGRSLGTQRTVRDLSLTFSPSLNILEKSLLLLSLSCLDRDSAPLRSFKLSG